MRFANTYYEFLNRIAKKYNLVIIEFHKKTWPSILRRNSNIFILRITQDPPGGYEKVLTRMRTAYLVAQYWLQAAEKAELGVVRSRDDTRKVIWTYDYLFGQRAFMGYGDLYDDIDLSILKSWWLKKPEEIPGFLPDSLLKSSYIDTIFNRAEVGDRTYVYLGLINSSQTTEKTFKVSFDRIPYLKTNKSYYAYELWEREYQGKLKDSIQVNVPATSAKVIVLTDEAPSVLYSENQLTQHEVDKPSGELRFRLVGMDKDRKIAILYPDISSFNLYELNYSATTPVIEIKNREIVKKINNYEAVFNPQTGILSVTIPQIAPEGTSFVLRKAGDL